MSSSNRLTDSFAFCRRVARNSNFYYGMLLAPRAKANAMFALYTWLHVMDEIADTPDCLPAEKLERLRTFFETTEALLVPNATREAAALGQFWPAFRETVLHYHISTIYLEKVLEGLRQDLIKNHYPTFDELYYYCTLVASAVGVMLIRIWGDDNDPEVSAMAEWCGVAFQLTNILRDIREDAKNHHVYLPAEFFGRQTLKEGDLATLPQDVLMRGIQTLMTKADAYYRQSASLYSHIDPGGRLSFLVLMNTYHSLFKKIRKNPAIVLGNKRVSLSRSEKLLAIIHAFLTRVC